MSFIKRIYNIMDKQLTKIENNIYVHLSDKEVRENAVVVCEKCGLEDYVVNLVPKVC